MKESRIELFYHRPDGFLRLPLYAGYYHYISYVGFSHLVYGNLRPSELEAYQVFQFLFAIAFYLTFVAHLFLTMFDGTKKILDSYDNYHIDIKLCIELEGPTHLRSKIEEVLYQLVLFPVRKTKEWFSKIKINEGVLTKLYSKLIEEKK